MLGITLSLKSVAGRNVEVKGKKGHSSSMEANWIEVAADSEYTINVNMRRTNRPKDGGGDRRAFAPKFPKPKDEGWFLVLGSVEVGTWNQNTRSTFQRGCRNAKCIVLKFQENELLALKRAGLPKGCGGGAQHQVTFFTPETPGRVVYTLYIMSDAYLGLDQQYDLCLDVVEGYEEVRKVAYRSAEK